MLQIVLPSILKAFRRMRDVTQEAAAELAGVSPLTWHRWETGKTAPNACQLADLARALGRTPLEFRAMLAEALHHHFTGKLAALESDGGDAAAVSRSLLNAICAEFSRATTNLEVVARQAKAAGNAAVISRLWASMDEARSVLDRVYAVLAAAAAAVTEESDEG